jgi:hypothetical protein
LLIQEKGIVESGVKYIKRSFLPLRAFRSLADANRQLLEWVLGEAGNRCHGTTEFVNLHWVLPHFVWKKVSQSTPLTPLNFRQRSWGSDGQLGEFCWRC